MCRIRRRRVERTMNASSATLDDRFETAGEGLLFILIAALRFPRGPAAPAAVAAVGALVLGLNAARFAAGVPVSWFSITIGASALIAGRAPWPGSPSTRSPCSSCSWGSSPGTAVFRSR